MANRYNGQNNTRQGRNNTPERDEEGRFVSDIRSSGRRGRLEEEDDTSRYSRSSKGSNRQDQDVWSDDSVRRSGITQRDWNERSPSLRGNRGNYAEDDDYRYSSRSGRGRDQINQGQGNWFDRTEDPSESPERNRNNRSPSLSGDRVNRFDEDDTYRSSSRSGKGRSQGHGGWFGDPAGHSEAAHRGWEDRR
jgi:hypothetical protein